MRILLVEPKPINDVFADSLVSAPSTPSLTLAMLAGAANQASHEVQILDLNVGNLDQESFFEKVINARPDVVGMSMYTTTYETVRGVAARIKEKIPEAILLTGGIHPTVLPEDVLSTTAFDVVVLGEGEQTLTEILDGREFSEINGLCYQTDSGLEHTKPRAHLENLDLLPMPAYQCFDLDRYDKRQILWKSRRIVMAESSRGCPFQCTFCASSPIVGKKWRTKSVDRVLEEIDYFLKLGFQEIHFQDDGFTTDLARAKEICRRIISLNHPIPWELYNGIRLDRVDEEFLELASRAGCYRIRFGVESGDQDVLDSVGKGIVLAKIEEVFKTVRKYNIETVALFIMGLPKEKPESLERTISFSCRIHPDFARTSILMPMPGSAIFSQWQTEGRIHLKDWTDFSFHTIDSLPYEHPNLSQEELASAYHRFYRKFYLRPVYLLERIYYGVRRGTLFRDLRYFVLKFLFNPLKKQLNK